MTNFWVRDPSTNEMILLDCRDPNQVVYNLAYFTIEALEEWQSHTDEYSFKNIYDNDFEIKNLCNNDTEIETLQVKNKKNNWSLVLYYKGKSGFYCRLSKLALLPEEEREYLKKFNPKTPAPNVKNIYAFQKIDFEPETSA